MTPEQLKELRRLAEAATPGPWGREDDANNHMLTAGFDADGCYIYPGTDTDAAFIAALSPDVALQLIAAAEQLDAAPSHAVVERIAIQRNLACAALGLQPNATPDEIRAKAGLLEAAMKERDEWKARAIELQYEPAAMAAEQMRLWEENALLDKFAEAARDHDMRGEALDAALAELDRVRGKG